MKNLVVLISGQGRNLQALIDHCAAGAIDARIAAVVSNRVEAPGLERARRAGIATQVVSHLDHASRESFDAALAAAIDCHTPDALALAGFMRILTPAFTRRYEGRALNIHPSLLPRHPGLRTHAAVLAAGETEHGATVHFVTAALDGGPRVLQGAVAVPQASTAESLAERVMADVELKIFPQALAWLLRGELVLREGAAWCHGQRLAAPLGMDRLEPAFR